MFKKVTNSQDDRAQFVCQYKRGLRLISLGLIAVRGAALDEVNDVG